MGLIVVGVPTAGFRPSQMVRSGAGANLGSGFTKVLGWAPDTANYPGSSVISDELVVIGDGDGLTVEANVEFTNSGFSTRTVTLRLVLGTSTVLATNGGTSISASGGVAFSSVSASGLTLADAQRVHLQAQPSAINNVSATANAASYVRIYRP